MRKLTVFLIMVSSALILLSFGGCIGKNSNSGTNGNDTSAKSVLTIKPGDKIKLDSIDKFVQVYILFNYELRKWQEEYGKNTNLAKDPETYLGQQREEFYKGLGLTEDEFIQYSTDHAQDVETFLEKNPAYKKEWDDSQK